MWWRALYVSEQPCQQGPSQVQPLIAVVVSVVFLAPPQGALQQAVDNVPEKVRLLGFAELLGADVGQHLLLQNVLGVPGGGEVQLKSAPRNSLAK